MAKDMHGLAERKQQDNAVHWWNSYKEKLLSEIKKRAANGFFELSIYETDELNKGGVITNLRLRTKVEDELKNLGYEVAFYGGSYHSDGDDKELKIKW